MNFSLLFLITVLLFVLSLLFVVAYFLVRKSSKTSSEIMIFGLAFMLLGGIIAVDQSSNLANAEYFLVLIGFVTVVAGFVKKNY